MYSSNARFHCRIGALRLVRALVGLKDDACLRFACKHGVFGAIVQALVANGQKYNMLNSAVIELFEYIKKVCVALLLVLYST